MAGMQDCAEVEIIDCQGNGSGPLAPNEVRINGVPVLCTDDPITVSPLSYGTVATVTLTLIVSKLTITSGSD